MKPIKLQIKKRITSYETNGYSYKCDVYLNGQKLGHGVTGLNLNMEAGSKPKLTVELIPDEIDADLPIELITLKKASETDHK